MLSTCFQTAEQAEVVKEVVLPEVSKLNDSESNKSHRDQTQFSPEKKTLKKENGFGTICMFAICYHTDKQTSKQYIILIYKLQSYM